MRAALVYGLFLVWAGLVVYGFYAYATTAPTDMGFTRGLNRIAEFLWWESGALLVALLDWLVARGGGDLGRGARWAGRAPILISGGFFLLLAVFFVGLIIYTRALN